MRKVYIKKLALSCYTEEHLDEKRVEQIASLLSQRELKQFVKILKTEEKKKTVVVTSAKKLKTQEQTALKDLYKGKSVYFQTDETLLTGMKIQNADMIYEQSLKNSLEQIEKEVVTL